MVGRQPAQSVVSILVPTLNEEEHITEMIASIIPEAPDFDYEILVIDGGSDDRTRALVLEHAERNPRIKFLLNERKLQSAAINLGARLADPAAEIVVRADSHAVYPPGFVETCVQSLRETEAQSVVVTMETRGSSWFQRGVAAAQNGLLGTGGAAHRLPGRSRFIDHGHHAAFRRDFFLAVGGYDETMVANEDVDLDMRIAQAGGKIWLDSSVPVVYFPRKTVRGLARQYFNYGRGRAISWRRHRYRLKLRQLAPVFVLAMTVGAAIGTLLGVPALWLLPLSYLLLCFAWGLTYALRERAPLLGLAAGSAAVVMHHAWALGFAAGHCRPAYRKDTHNG